MPKTVAEMVSDRLAQVPALSRPELLELRGRATRVAEAGPLVAAIDARLAELDLAASIKVHEAEFARVMLRIVEGSGGDWVAAADVFRRAKVEAADSPYVAYIAASSGRQKGLTAALERVRSAEFPHVERRKDGPDTWDRVHFRVVGARQGDVV